MSYISGYFYRGRHRAPSTTARTAARVAVVGATFSAPVALAQPAFAEPPGGWEPIIACESGGDPRAVSADGASSGLLGISDEDWERLGGVGQARDETPEGQIAAADVLLEQEGTEPWADTQQCWDGLVQPVSAPEPPAEELYTIVRGDTLSEIALAHDTTVEALTELNGIADPDLIFAGDQLRLR